jgi:hypothetical protein
MEQKRVLPKKVSNPPRSSKIGSPQQLTITYSTKEVALFIHIKSRNRQGFWSGSTSPRKKFHHIN